MCFYIKFVSGGRYVIDKIKFLFGIKDFSKVKSFVDSTLLVSLPLFLYCWQKGQWTLSSRSHPSSFNVPQSFLVSPQNCDLGLEVLGIVKRQSDSGPPSKEGPNTKGWLRQ